MSKQPRVETVDEFKLRIAAILRAKSEEIPGPSREPPRKQTSNRKSKRRRR